MASPAEQYVDTPGGQARVVTHAAEKPRAVLLLGHGAGAGIDTADLVALAEGLPAVGVTAQLLEQPWRVAGRKIAGPPATLDTALLAVTSALAPARGGVPLLLGGRSAGARSAARCALDAGAVGVLALSFPLHPPGKPEKSRLHELEAAGVPTLVVQGEKDPFGRPEEFPAPTVLCPVPHADHSFKVAKRAPITPDEVASVIVACVVEWLERELS